MEDQVFGELTKRVATAPSRRALVRTLSGGIAAAAMTALHRPAPVVAQEVDDEARLCRPANLPCRDKMQCCARKCVRGTFLGQPAKVCGCNKKGKDCIHGLGQTCCSGRCTKHGKCS